MLRRSFLDERITRYSQITVPDWVAIPDNPRQRDTELHAKDALEYLSMPVPPHVEVKMAQLPDGTKWKLDGHTRAFLWATKQIPVPDMLEVAIYELRSIGEVIQAYDWFDNAKASERSSHVVQGAFRANGLHPKSHMLRTGQVNVALKRLFRMVNEDYTKARWEYDMIYEAIRFFSIELMKLDALQPTRKLFPPGVAMAVLMTFRNDEVDAERFWTAYAAERGRRDGEQMDAVQALTESVIASKLRVAKTHTDVTSDVFARALSAFFAFQSGQPYMVGGPGVRSLSMPVVKKYLARRPA